MRLICPNCGAQYEVDARVIPDAGRDVQCSNCGHTWFQNPPHLDADLADELGYDAPTGAEAEDETEDAQVPVPPVHAFDTSESDELPASEQSPSASAATAAPAGQDPADDAGAAEPEDVPAGDEDAMPGLSEVEDEPEIAAAEGPLPAPRGSGIKESVRDILRAEVEFDQEMRRGAPDTLESQPELGLDEPAQDPARQSLRDRMARLRGLESAASAAAGTGAATAKRRDLLPDIEEINSTLSPASDRDEDGTVPDAETRRARAERSGFRTAFSVLVLVSVLLVALYVLAPMIAGRVPALASAMEGYISGANAFRTWLDGIMENAGARLNALLNQLNGA
ncbi:zinc-ribbon domain-containing protein [Celeribacter indicus]|uniref:Zinc finger/thioredoxin putative domain-containing protein n=1 Tax=Celeribacter indicus TaxID=1208324 RepID=A0A0B5E101_9RHOB|nr:zinc-ribbon domain-containing protein [Celeribacter indicus]AJE48964.1 hypothetical protein P73_4249 [Celeribacter indicus]